MVEVRGLVDKNPSNAQPKLNGRPGPILGRDLERIRSKRTVRTRGYARRNRLVAAMVIVAAFFLSAAFALPISLSTDMSDKTVLVNPLGTVGDVSWTNMSPSISPGPRCIGAFAYDPPTDTYLLFGGMDEDGSFCNDTWSYDLGTNSWQNRSPAIHPDMILGPAYAYDSVDEIMLVFPCIKGYVTMNETWSYDASTNEWKDLAATNAPSLKIYSSGAYDSESDRFVVFGGMDLSGMTAVNETWSYDFTSNTWTNMTPAYSPPPVYGNTMAYDSESDRIIIFGGMGNDYFFNGTWSYDLDSNTWTNMTPHSGPSERYGVSAVYDPVSDLVLTFGGIGVKDGVGGPEMAFFDDMWTYDYNSDTWSEINQLIRPTARALGHMAIDPLTRAIVIYGGEYAESSESQPIYLGDTWSVQLGAPIPEFHTVVLPAVGVIAIVTALAGLKRRTRNQTLD